MSSEEKFRIETFYAIIDRIAIDLNNRIRAYSETAPLKKGCSTTHLEVFVRLFRNNTPWSVVVTAQECYSQHP